VAVAGLAAAEIPRVGVVDFYGLREVPEKRARSALGISEGDPLPPSKADLEERLESVSGVVRAHVAAVCCDAGKVTLFVGIEEKGAPHFEYRTPPVGDVRLPDELVATYRDFTDAVRVAVLEDDAQEDISRGHSLMANARVRSVQERFLTHAGAHLNLLKDVLRNSGDGEHRGVAAWILGYSLRKQLVIDDLQHALQDPDDVVRNNAMRSLMAIAELAYRDPTLELKIAPTWLIEMLNSLIWTDRTKAAAGLERLTRSRDPNAIAQLAERALPAVLEMAHWKSATHAKPAYVIAGRVAGLSEEEIEKSWVADNREVVLGRFRKSKR
jgi:hypothetical protein